MKTNNESEKAPSTRVFIGSSSKGKKIAQVAGKLLESKDSKDDKKIDVVVWDKLFKIGETYIERLSKALEEFDFAVLVITGEDFVMSEDGKYLKARENVLFELGLFMGRLGRHRAIMLYDKEQKANLPSDLGGIHRATFSTPKNKTDEELENALKDPCNEIREYILNPYEEEIKVFEVWKNSCHQLYEALEEAPIDTTIRIIQTWFPDVEDFIINLKKLLIEKKKRFKLEILLMNDKECDNKNYFNILDARIKLRLETRKRAIEKIEETIEQLKKLKELVDDNWNAKGKNSKLKLEIRKYDFLPFGPFYQVGDKVMFVGFYLNHCSSIHAPMVKIHNTAREAWNKFTEHFDTAWNDPDVVKLYPETKGGKNSN